LREGRNTVKEIDEVNLPDGIGYAQTHEWARVEGDVVKIGISDYAQDSLGDITFVEMPQVGDAFKKGEQCGSVESIKAVSELYMPVGGEITAVNEALIDSPGLINSDPYGEGWILTVTPESPEEMESLMKGPAYREMLKGLE